MRNPSLDYGADVRVAIHGRIVKPLLDMTLLFLGLPLVVTRESRNVFIAMGLCMARDGRVHAGGDRAARARRGELFAQPGAGRLGSADDLRPAGGGDGRVALEVRPEPLRRGGVYTWCCQGYTRVVGILDTF